MKADVCLKFKIRKKDKAIIITDRATQIWLYNQTIKYNTRIIKKAIKEQTKESQK